MAANTLLDIIDHPGGSVELAHNQIVTGIIEDVIDINPIFAVIPFVPYTGQALTGNREDSIMSDPATNNLADTFAVGNTIDTKAPMTWTRQAFSATKIIGDAEIDNLVAATSQSGGFEQIATEIAAKSKAVGKVAQLGLATGTGSGAALNSLHTLVDASQFTANEAGPGPVNLSFDKLDEMTELVVDKNGQVDWLMFPKPFMRFYRQLLRAQGGAAADQVVDIPFRDGTQRQVLTYEGVPIFRNDYLSTVETLNGAALTGGTMSSVWAGTFDDGTNRVGVAGIYPSGTMAGIGVEPVGTMETKDERIWRIKWYMNWALLNRRGLARGTSVDPANAS